jgi:hypothetical protein
VHSLIECTADFDAVRWVWQTDSTVVFLCISGW